MPPRRIVKPSGDIALLVNTKHLGSSRSGAWIDDRDQFPSAREDVAACLARPAIAIRADEVAGVIRVSDDGVARGRDVKRLKLSARVQQEAVARIAERVGADDGAVFANAFGLSALRPGVVEDGELARRNHHAPKGKVGS